MKNAVLYLVIVSIVCCLVVSNAIVANALAQPVSSEDTAENAIDNRVDVKPVEEDTTGDETEQDPEEVDVDSNTKSEEKLDREPTNESQCKATDLKDLRQARDDERPPQQRRSTDDAETYTYSIVPTSPRPPSGNGFIIPGSIALGIGTGGVGMSIAVLTVFRDDSDSDNENSKADTVLAFSLISSSVLVVIGIPLLIIGLNRRSELIEWKKKNPGFAGLDFQFSQQKAVASWETAF